MPIIPCHVRQILTLLAQNGYEAYAVGGCVRDTLLGRDAQDWDICTNALPEQVLRAFAAFPTRDAWVRHGAVTVFVGPLSAEVTTYRADGAYSDRRRPDAVRFVSTLAEDLRRRDFTVNALALSLDGTVADPLGGRSDLDARTLRCVGGPDRRFREDALRILRCIRFAAVLGFTVEPDTAAALRRHKHLLETLSAERVNWELCKLLRAETILPAFAEYADLWAVRLPEILTCDFAAVQDAPPEPAARLAVILRGRADAEETLKRLRFDKKTIRRVLERTTV
jgi:tRNA nucleotidyltransferase (CCA-adding enzyme)